ncbi:MAG TPA: reverse transcriptase domain-containing protein, partial [Oculatellaceae cyanobacterium]
YPSRGTDASPASVIEASAVNGDNGENSVYFDSCCDMNILIMRKWFIEKHSPKNGPIKVRGVSGDLVDVSEVGTVKLRVVVDGKVREQEFKNAAFVPSIPYSLVSNKAMIDEKHVLSVTVGHDGFQHWRVHASLTDHSVLYEAIVYHSKPLVVCEHHSSLVQALSAATSSPPAPHASSRKVVVPNDRTIRLFHNRRGHVGWKTLRVYLESVGFTIPSNLVPPMCHICNVAKMRKKPHPLSEVRATTTMERLHTDVAQIDDHYFTVVVDCMSKRASTVVLKHKNESPTKVKHCINLLTNLTGHPCKYLRFDNGELTTNDFIAFLNERGILPERTVIGTPQQNGTSERIIQTLMNMTRALMQQSGLPRRYVDFALAMATHIYNNMPHSSNQGKAPNEFWPGFSPRSSDLCSFGCLAYSHAGNNKHLSKLTPRADVGVYLGPDPEKKRGDFFLNLKTRVIQSRYDVDLVEDQFPLRKEKDNCEFVEGEPIYFGVRAQPCQVDDEDEEEEEKQNTVVAEKPNEALTEKKLKESNMEAKMDERNGNERNGGRVLLEMKNEEAGASGEQEEDETEPAKEHQEKEKQDANEKRKTRSLRIVNRKYADYYVVDDIKPAYHNRIDGDVSVVDVMSADGPQSLQEALSGKDKDRWRESIEHEIKSQIENGVFSERPVQPNPSKKVIPTKFVFQTKRDGNGQIIKFKTRLVALGYRQKPGVDYDESSSPVANTDSIRILTAMSTTPGFQTYSADVSSAFLQSTEKLDRQTFIRLPDLLDTKSNYSGSVRELIKPLYGLPEAGRKWWLSLDKRLREIGLKPTKSDPCVYRCRDGPT